jgi:hypothetical protein
MRRSNARPVCLPWLLVLAALGLHGCTTDAIIVSEVAITDRADARVVGWSADEEPRQVFSPEDEEVTIKVLFAFNYRAVYEWYTVEWVAPDGSPYQVLSLRTDFGSHRDLKASLPIRGKMASRMPGIWRVRIWLRGREGAPDRLLAARIFRIAQPSAELLARGLTPVDGPPGTGTRPLASEPSLEVASAPDSASRPGPASPAPGQARAGEPDVLPPLAVSAARAAATPPAAPPPGSGATPVAPLPAQAGVSMVTLEATSQRGARPRHGYVGCPPLYYAPGPGCVERAPEE